MYFHGGLVEYIYIQSTTVVDWHTVISIHNGNNHGGLAIPIGYSNKLTVIDFPIQHSWEFALLCLLLYPNGMQIQRPKKCWIENPNFLTCVKTIQNSACGLVLDWFNTREISLDFSIQHFSSHWITTFQYGTILWQLWYIFLCIGANLPNCVTLINVTCFSTIPTVIH